ncbi:MAG: 4Fe-4S dicluster domain-containing protein [bacterium]
MASTCLRKDQQANWLAKLSESFAVFVPVGTENHVHWQRHAPPGSPGTTQSPVPALEEIRAAEPVKAFLFSSRETVAGLPDPLTPGPAEKRVLFGVKACDLAALAAQKKMFLEGEFADPFYKARLDNTVLVAADCPNPADSCFCSLVGGKPWAESGADLVVSVVDGDWLLEPLTKRGEELVMQSGAGLAPALDRQVARRDEQRKAAVQKLAEVNPTALPADLPARLHKRETDRAFYREHAASCVECFGCLMTCPTCYCFLLYDRAKEGGMERTKTWDACYLGAYQRVGGGANPRGEFLKRFSNRFECKFEHFKNANGFYACSGCGRCFKVCMGKIDIRKVLGSA